VEQEEDFKRGNHEGHEERLARKEVRIQDSEGSVAPQRRKERKGKIPMPKMS
jgi:hypothetical protein